MGYGIFDLTKFNGCWINIYVQNLIYMVKQFAIENINWEMLIVKVISKKKLIMYFTINKVGSRQIFERRECRT